jgi:hypothetical protein
MKTIKSVFESYAIAFLFVCFFIFSLTQGPQFQADSGSYELGSIIRIGMYPLIITLFKAVFKTYAFNFLAFFQVSFTLLSINLLTKFLKKQFALNFYLYFVCVLFFLFPATFNGAEYFIISESLAYPLFLVTLLFFFQFVVHKKNKDALLFIVTLLLLCFTRQQFVFFYVVAFIYGLYLVGVEKKLKSARNLVFFSIISMATFFITERTYHYIFHGHFAGTPFVGTQFLMRPLFVASSDSLKSITDHKQRLFIDEVVKKLIEKDIISPDSPIKEIYMYEYLYNTMYHGVSAGVWGKVWSKDVLSAECHKTLDDFEVQQTIDRNALFMGIHLLKTNFLKVITHYVKDVIRGMGGYFSVLLIGIISIYCFAVILMRNKSDNLIYIFTLSTVLMHLGNASLVCLFEPPLTRYMYATGTILAVMIFIVLSKLFLCSKNDHLCVE